MPRTLLVLVALLAVFAAGCSSEDYPQDTPDAAVQSAVKMVKNRDAAKLSDLIYADSPQMRSVLNRFGRLLGKTQKLAESINRRFPKEVENLKAEALKRTQEGKGGLFSQIGAGMQGGNRRGGDGPPFDEDAMKSLAKEIFADPFGFIDRNAERITTMPVTDDLAMLLLDDKPVMPPLGLNLKKDGDKWYLLLPTNIPGVNTALPKTETEWKIMGSLMKVGELGVEDMAKDVDSGAISAMSQLQEKFVEKMLVPGGLVFAAYGRELDVRNRVDRRMTQFNNRLRTWADARKDRDGAPVSTKLTQAISRIALKNLEPMVRKGEKWNAETASDSEFEAAVQKWLDAAGLGVSLSGELSGKVVEEAVTRYEQEAAKPAPRK